MRHSREFWKRYHLFVLVLMAAKLWLVTAHYVMATITPHDDLHFVYQAHSLLSGNWLGDYNQFTLIKGPFYPMFMALSYYLGIPLLASQQLLYGLACLVAVRAISPLVNRSWILPIIFVILFLNPFSYNYPAVGRLFRLGIYQSLALLSFALVLGSCVRLSRPWKQLLPWVISAGVSLAAFWNTREESIWLLPSMGLLIAFSLFVSRKEGKKTFLVRTGCCLVPFLILGLTNSWLKYQNLKHYGIRATIELETPQFAAAYGGLLRVRSDSWMQYYPVVKDVREKVYGVSPAFQELKPYLEGPLAQKWFGLCVGCPDLPAAFFIWVLRDAVAAAGYYDEGPRTLAYYQRIGDEIDQACEEGRLNCRPRYTSLVPPWHMEYNKLFLPTFFEVLKHMVSFRDARASNSNWISKGKREDIQIYETITRERILTSDRQYLKSYPEYHRHLDREKTRILEDIGDFYKVTVPVFFLLALAMFTARLVMAFRGKTLSFFTVLSGSALVGILAMTFILTLLTITSYSEIARALHSSYPIVLLFVVSTILDYCCGKGVARQE